MKNNLSNLLKNYLIAQGADLVGFSSLAELPPEARQSLPVGVAIAVKYSKEVIRGIHDLPTAAYYEQYSFLNNQLDALAESGAKMLQDAGFTAIAQTRAYVEQFVTDDSTLLPHKTVATRAGLGWIGKCALLVTKKYGSMIRITSVLTDAPLETAKPVNAAQCGDCMVCAEACPAGAVSGKQWSAGLAREDFFDAASCRKTTRERSLLGFGVEITICGKCIEVCPWTQKYLAEQKTESEIIFERAKELRDEV